MSTDSPTISPRIDGPPQVELTRFFDRHWRAIVKTRTGAIDAYLRAERDTLAAWLGEGDTRFVVEVGCADGELMLPTVLRRPGVGYLGIDLATDAIAVTRATTRRVTDRYADAVAGDVVDLAALVAGRPLPATGLLTVLPFNVLGELRAPRTALAAAARCGSDVAIFTYNSTPLARRVREDYYRRCGFDGYWDTTGDGLAYRTADGFFSTVYPARRVRRWLTAAGYVVDEVHALTPYASAYRARLVAPHSSRVR